MAKPLVVVFCGLFILVFLLISVKFFYQKFQKYNSEKNKDDNNKNDNENNINNEICHENDVCKNESFLEEFKDFSKLSKMSEEQTVIPEDFESSKNSESSQSSFENVPSYHTPSYHTPIIKEIAKPRKIMMTKNKPKPLEEEKSNDIKSILMGKNSVAKVCSNRKISAGEKECCRVMEKIYGKPFKSIWPKWLKNPETGRLLELDCYNEELGIAVEYNGEQHYIHPNFTNNSFEDFQKQLRRDDFKRRMCDLNGVYLIPVPYSVPISEIEEHIIKHLPEY